MLTMIPTEPKNLIAYRTGEKITVKDFDQVTARIEEKLEAGEQDLRMYAEIESVSGIEPQALLEEFKFLTRHAKDLDRFHRIAVVSDDDWVKKLTSVEDTVVPGIAIETFPSAERERAMAWATS